MSVPGIGAIVAITSKSGVDDPSRFRRSRDVGPHFGKKARVALARKLAVIPHRMWVDGAGLRWSNEATAIA
jgi:hypothetical protein